MRIMGGALGALREAAVDRMTAHAVRWRSMGVLFATGGLLALVSLLLPHPAELQPLPIALLGATALVAGAVMLVAAPRLSLRWMSPTLAFGTALVTAGVGFSGDPSSSYALFYVWVGFEAVYFLDRRHTLAHLLLVAVAYAVLLIELAGPGEGAAARWLMTVGTVTAVTVLAALLRERADRLIRRLADAARTDPLTGLLNRRGFEHELELELERAARAGQPMSLVIGDLDHFKALNDRYGHRAGDEALTRFAAQCAQAVRRIDVVARIGGEEFALVLPSTDGQGAFTLAERLRRSVRSDADRPWRLTVSLGIADFPAQGASAEALLHAADQALYMAKRLGRDRTVVYSTDVAGALADPVAGSGRAEHAAAVLLLAETLDLRDSGTADHSRIVGRYAELTAERLGLKADHVERIRLAGVLHDIGKVGVPDPILAKPGPLTAEEWSEMRRHPELGARILAGAGLDDISEWVLAHHERPDGRGYPLGLTAGEIPLAARILSVVDAYEAMTSDRVYRAALGHDRAAAELRAGAGSQFDAEIVEVFLAALAAAQGEPLAPAVSAQ